MEDEANKKSQRIILELNKSGMEYLSHDQYRQALQLLKKAQRVLGEELRLREKDVQLNRLYGITLNNLGCYYKKKNKPKVALIYLKKALEIEVYNVEDWIATAGTHLNICAIFSLMGKHAEAADHAGLSVMLLERERSTTAGKPNMKDSKDINAATLSNTLMISYYNSGVELQYLKKFEESCEAYKKGLQAAKSTKRGQDMIKTLEDSIRRTTQSQKAHERRVMQLNQKRREMDEKGHCEFMRKNKKHEIIHRDENQPMRYAEYTITQPQERSISTTERLSKGVSEVRIIRRTPNQSKAQQHRSGQLPSVNKEPLRSQ